MHISRTMWGIAAFLGTIALIGCGSGSTDIAFQGGGLPPGDPDIGGVVVADSGDVQTAQDSEVGIEGAEVVLFRGQHAVGSTTTGPGGYFRFEHPLTGNYVLEITAPEGSGLGGARREFYHQQGQQTFLRITLEPSDDPGPPAHGVR